jgi:hypothetical protein
MSYIQSDNLSLTAGLYVVTRESPDKPWVDHFALLDIGNNFRIPGADGVNATLVHQAPPQIQWDWFANTGSWRLIGRVVDGAGAVQRFWQIAQGRPWYSVLDNNCEHVLWYVVTGRHKSPQVGRGLLALGLATVVVWAWNKAA